MTIWMILWVLLSAALLGFMVWSGYIIYRQKKAWKAYAARYKLRYTPGGFYESPSMSGMMGDYGVSVFTGQHARADSRSIRKMSAIEIKLSTILPSEGAVTSGGFVDTLRELEFSRELRMEHPSWKKSYMVVCDAPHVMRSYLTPDRLEGLIDLMRVPSGWVILIFKSETGLLRFDTPKPLDTPESVDKIIKKMLKLAKILELSATEERTLKEEQARKPDKDAALDVNEEVLEHHGLELEEDQDDAP